MVKEPGRVAHTCGPNTWEVVIGRVLVRGQHNLENLRLDYIGRTTLTQKCQESLLKHGSGSSDCSGVFLKVCERTKNKGHMGKVNS